MPTRVFVGAVPNRWKLLFWRMRIIGAIIWPNVNRIWIVIIMRCCPLSKQYVSFRFIVIIITNDTGIYTRLVVKIFSQRTCSLIRTNVNTWANLAKKMLTCYAGCSLSSWHLATLSHQQVNGFDALSQLTCCSQRTDWDYAVASPNDMSLGDASRHRVEMSCYMAHYSAADSKLSVTGIEELWRAYFLWTSCLWSRNVDALISASCDCSCLSIMVLAADEAAALVLIVLFTCCHCKPPFFPVELYSYLVYFWQYYLAE